MMVDDKKESLAEIHDYFGKDFETRSAKLSYNELLSMRRDVEKQLDGIDGYTYIDVEANQLCVEIGNHEADAKGAIENVKKPIPI